MYSTENEEKSSVWERWNKTIKTKMWKQFTVQGNTKYLEMLPKIWQWYNSTKHSSIKMTEASEKKNEAKVWYILICTVILNHHHRNQSSKWVIKY